MKQDNNLDFQLCFNRTFMELKFEKTAIDEDVIKVLIVPLWN